MKISSATDSNHSGKPPTASQVCRGIHRHAPVATPTSRASTASSMGIGIQERVGAIAAIDQSTLHPSHIGEDPECNPAALIGECEETLQTAWTQHRVVVEQQYITASATCATMRLLLTQKPRLVSLAMTLGVREACRMSDRESSVERSSCTSTSIVKSPSCEYTDARQSSTKSPPL